MFVCVFIEYENYGFLVQRVFTNGTDLHSIYLLEWKGEEVVTGEQECIHSKEKIEQANIIHLAEKLRFLV